MESDKIEQIDKNKENVIKPAGRNKDITLTIYFKSPDKKKICRSFIDHLKTKTGMTQDEIMVKALELYNLQFDERGNMK